MDQDQSPHSPPSSMSVRGFRWLSWRGAARAAGVTVITGALVGVAGFGISALHLRAAAKSDPEIRDPLPVTTVVANHVDGYRKLERFAGRVEAVDETDLAFELAGLVREMLVEEGDRVTAGAPVAMLDTALLSDEKGRLQAVRQSQEARLVLARRTYKRQSTLRKQGHAPTARVDEAESEVNALIADIAATDAAIKSIDTRIDKSTLMAPFDGVVAARAVDPGAVVEAGMPVVRVLSADRPRVRVGVASDLAAGLAKGTAVDVAIEGRTQSGTVEAVLPDVDSATRTVEVLLRVDGPATVGEIARLTLERRVSMTGTWLPRDALGEGRKGLWTVLTIEDGADGPVAASEAVQILHAETARVFVAGTLADGARVVASGRERLVPGQAVSVLTASAGRQP